MAGPYSRSRSPPLRLIQFASRPNSPPLGPSVLGDTDDEEMHDLTKTCPVCETKIPVSYLNESPFVDHVDECCMKQVIAQSVERRASQSDSSARSNMDEPNSVQAQIELSRYTLSGTGDAHEFGGFGGSGGEYADLFREPASVRLRKKRLMGRAAFRRRLALDLGG